MGAIDFLHFAYIQFVSSSPGICNSCTIKSYLKHTETCLLTFCRNAGLYLPPPLECSRNNFLPLVWHSHKDSWFGICSSLSWPLWPHLTPQYWPLPRGRECVRCGRELGGSPEHAQLPPLLPPSSACPQGVHPGLLSALRWAYQAPCPYCGGWQEWDGFQTVLGSRTPKAQFPMSFISNRAPFVSCLLLLCPVPKVGGGHRAVI